MPHRLRRRYGRSTGAGEPALSAVRTLFRAPDTLALYGIPYRMREDVGQQPGDLWRAGNTKGWIWLGSPGWYGSMSAGRAAEVQAFVAAQTARGIVPGNPYEWSYL